MGGTEVPVAQACLGQRMYGSGKFADEPLQRRPIADVQRQIRDGAAREFLYDLISALAPSTGRDYLGDVIARKFSQQIVDRSVWLGRGRIQR